MMWSSGGGTPWLSLGGKLLCCNLSSPRLRTVRREVKIVVVSVRVRVVAQTMTRGDGVMVLGQVGGSHVRRETFASMSTLAQLVFSSGAFRVFPARADVTRWCADS